MPKKKERDRRKKRIAMVVLGSRLEGRYRGEGAAPGADGWDAAPVDAE